MKRYPISNKHCLALVLVGAALSIATPSLAASPVPKNKVLGKINPKESLAIGYFGADLGEVLPEINEVADFGRTRGISVELFSMPNFDGPIAFPVSIAAKTILIFDGGEQSDLRFNKISSSFFPGKKVIFGLGRPIDPNVRITKTSYVAGVKADDPFIFADVAKALPDRRPIGSIPLVGGDCSGSGAQRQFEASGFAITCLDTPIRNDQKLETQQEYFERVVKPSGARLVWAPFLNFPPDGKVVLQSGDPYLMGFFPSFDIWLRPQIQVVQARVVIELLAKHKPLPLVMRVPDDAKVIRLGYSARVTEAERAGIAAVLLGRTDAKRFVG
jgi:hypothetical protein